MGETRFSIESADGEKRSIQEVLEEGGDLKLVGPARELLALFEAGIATMEALGQVERASLQAIGEDGEVLAEEGSENNNDRINDESVTFH